MPTGGGLVHNHGVPSDPDYGVPEMVAAASRVFATTQRVAILGLLAHAPMTQAQLARRLATTDYAIAKNIRVLAEAGVVASPPTGRRGVPLQIDADRTRALSDALRRYVTARRRSQ